MPGSAGAALAAFDAALRSRPHADPALFKAATREVSALRDALIADGRRTGHYDRARLSAVNAVLGMVLAGRFPLGTVPWPELEKAHAWLAAAAGGGEAPGTGDGPRRPE